MASPEAGADHALAERWSSLSPEKRELLRRRLQARQPARREAGIPRSGAPGEDAPLSYPQERMWFLDRLQPTAAYNDFLACRVAGALDAERMRRCLERIVHRHEVLRTRFVETDGEPRQRVEPPAPLTLPRVDLSALPEERRRGEGVARVRAVVRRAVPLDAAPPRRFLLVRLAAEEHLLALVVHHVLIDGWSWGVLLAELAALYEDLETALPELPIQYADYARWQRRRLAGDGGGDSSEAPLAAGAADLDYWTRRLDGLPALLDLPTDRPRPAVQSFAGSAVPFALAPAEAEALRAVARGQGATLFMALAAAFAALLHRYTGARDLALGTPVLGRERPETQRLIGVFVNALVLRAAPAPERTFAELLAQVRATVGEALAHQEVPFERLVEALDPRRDLGHSPLFQVMFDLQPPAPRERPAAGLVLERLELPAETTRFDLNLHLEEDERGAVAGLLQYRTDLWDAATAERMARHLHRLVRAVSAEPGARLGEIDLLLPAERQALAEWGDGGPPRALPPRGEEAAGEAASVEAAVAAVARRRPDAVALETAGGCLTYGELLRRADRLAGRLAALGVGPEVRVGVCLSRSPELVIALVAVLRAGGAYVPLDPAHPRERLELILADAGVGVLLADAASRGAVAPPPGAVRLELAAGAEPAAAGAPADVPPPPEAPAEPASLAYAIYTSGSTGRPKGVAVPRATLAAFLAAMAERPGLGAGDRLAAVTTVAFDIAALELFLPLVTGASVALVDGEEAADGARLARRLAETGAVVMQATPATWRLLLEDGGLPVGLRVLCGGEALPRDLADRLLGAAPEVWNLYGPTETTVWSAARRPEGGGGAVRIGGPIAGTTLRVAGAGLRQVPPGAAGELLIGGAGVARGYLARPALTAERFVPDPWAAAPGRRLYRTGDLVRYRPDGSLEFLGRLDHQVKLRGFRIELGEIEAVLAAHPAVREAAVVLWEPGAGDQRLVAYLVTAEPQDAASQDAAEPATGEPDEAAVAEVLEHARRRLPAYMVPSAVVWLQALPRNPNGKVDRRRLPAPAWRAAAEHVAPRGPLEEELAAIWSEVLGRPEIGVHDDFFQLGGHSLLATRVVARVRRRLGVDLPVARLFDRPTVAALAEELSKLRREAGAGAAGPPLEPVERGADLPLSVNQNGVWLHEQLGGASGMNHLPIAFRLRGPLEPVALGRAMERVVARHEVLRTRYPLSPAGGPRQVVEEAPGRFYGRVDLDGLPPERCGAEVERLAAAEAARRFDLETGPVLRVRLVRLEAERHVLLVTVHHVAADAWSLGLLVRELAALYEEAAEGRAAALAPLPVQYADFAVWQRGWLAGPQREEAVAFWRRTLAGAPAELELPADRPRDGLQSFAGGRETLDLPEDLLAGLRRVAAEREATPFAVLLAAFQVLLAELAGERDVVVGVPVSGRSEPEVENLVGCFINALALRAQVDGAASLGELVERARGGFLAASAHQALPFETLVEELRPRRRPNQQPVFQVVFNHYLDPLPVLRLRRLEIAPFELRHEVSKYDLTLYVTEYRGRWRVRMVYNRALFAAATVAGWLRAYERLLRLVADEPALAAAEAWRRVAQAEVERRTDVERAAREERRRNLQGLRRRPRPAAGAGAEAPNDAT